MRNLLGSVAVLVASLLFAGGAAAVEPTTKPAAGADFVVSDMRVQTLAGGTYLYGTTETTFTDIKKAIDGLMPKVDKALADGTAREVGGVLFLYEHVTDMNAKFTLSIGVVTPEGQKSVGDLKVKKLESYRCATVIYSGKLESIPEAYNRLMGALGAAKLEPVGHSREYYLHWKGETSPNNVVLIAMGVK